MQIFIFILQLISIKDSILIIGTTIWRIYDNSIKSLYQELQWLYHKFIFFEIFTNYKKLLTTQQLNNYYYYYYNDAID